MHSIHEKIKALEAQLRDLDSKKSALQAELKNAHAELAKLSSTNSTEFHNAFSPPLTEEIVRKHLGGEDFKGSKRDHTIGIYPMLADDTCNNKLSLQPRVLKIE